MAPFDPLSPSLERALRWAAVGHRGQVRRGSDVPYVAHPMAVALILDRLGFEEPVVVAGLLHDLVEDTDHLDGVSADDDGERVAALGAWGQAHRRSPGAADGSPGRSRT